MVPGSQSVEDSTCSLPITLGSSGQTFLGVTDSVSVGILVFAIPSLWERVGRNPLTEFLLKNPEEPFTSPFYIPAERLSAKLEISCGLAPSSESGATCLPVGHASLLEGSLPSRWADVL